ncbi:MAG: hypothetical protein ACF8PN_01520 [Phycisphaerales bacterium]
MRIAHRMLMFGSIGAVAAATGGLAPAAAADIIDPGVYFLENHPDGNANPPAYGLRLDELQDVTAGHDVFTFDFEADDSDMRMSWDGTSLRIFGVAFGGLDIGGSYDPNHSGLWAIDFTYSEVVTAPGDDDLIVVTPDGTNTGTIQFVDGGDVIPLWDFSGHHGFTFRLGDENDDEGHRGFDGLSGWGWLNHTVQNQHVYASDWLFTVGDEVPAPGPLALLTAGLFCVAQGRRRRGQ